MIPSFPPLSFTHSDRSTTCMGTEEDTQLPLPQLPVDDYGISPGGESYQCFFTKAPDPCCRGFSSRQWRQRDLRLLSTQFSFIKQKLGLKHSRWRIPGPQLLSPEPSTMLVKQGVSEKCGTVLGPAPEQSYRDCCPEEEERRNYR